MDLFPPRIFHQVPADMSWKQDGIAEQQMHFNKGGHTPVFLCISPIFFNKQDSEESKTRKSGYGFNNSALANSTLVQSEFGDVHKKFSTAPNLPTITTRFTGQLTLINSGEVSSTSGL